MGSPARPTAARAAPLAALVAVLSASCGDGADPGAPRRGPAPAGGLVLVDPANPAHPGWVDLGDLPLGEVRAYEIPLRNLDPRPVTVRSIRAGCACLAVEALTYDGPEGEVRGDPRASGDVLTVPAGATATLHLRVDTLRAPVRNKPKLVSVRIVSDSAVEPYLTVEARVFVEAPFRTAPDVVDLGRVPVHGGGTGATRIFPADESGRRVLEVAEVPEGFEATLTESYHLGVTAWDLELRALPPVELGYREHRVLLATTGPDGQGDGDPWRVEVRVNGVPDVEVRPPRLALRAPAAGEAPRAEVQVVSHLPGHLLRIESAAPEGPRADELLIELRPDRLDDDGRSPSWTVVVTGPGDLEAGAAGTLTLALDDPQQPELVVPYLSLGGS